ncbi:AAEL003244-PA [Aedes aegypti]|uniref:AAEL003244-PA n=1 Tax=Aedes aegypti TaxID=7159 RepID=Q17FZ8_AEDAE|nr:AAEL003244-PA [Aedes aegypti]
MYCWGANSHGQLGLGFSSELCETPHHVESLPFDPSRIGGISAGGGHTLLTLDPTGEVYCTGWNNRGQLGLGHLEDVCHFTLVGRFGFRSIACGWDVSGAVSHEGDLFLWGSNVWHQVADQGVKCLTVPTMLQLPNGARAQKVCFGLKHTCVLTDQGKLLVFGKAKWLQQEGTTQSSVLHGGVQFYELGFPEPVADVASGENHLVILLGQQRIACVGDNKFGQSPKAIMECNQEQRQDVVKQLESGWSHSGYLMSDGRVYLWGRNNYGQLGVAKTDDDRIENGPAKVLDVESEVVKFCLGSQHGMSLTREGVYTWGWNEHGNCGTGGVQNVWSPIRIEGMVNIKDIAAGAGFCWALKKL